MNKHFNIIVYGLIILIVDKISIFWILYIMKKIILITILLTIILKNSYSIENNIIYEYIYNLTNEMQNIRQYCISFSISIYTINNNELQLAEEDIKNNISTFLINKNERMELIISNYVLARIFKIIDFEVDNVLDIDFINNFDEAFRKIDIILDLLMLALIINYYDLILVE